MRIRTVLTWAVLALALASAIALRMAVGGPIPDDDRGAILGLRLSRAAAGTVTGACLAAAGAMLQCLLRNPLASPDLLGLASGAGFGVMLAAYAAYRAGMGIAPGAASAPAALVGALAALASVYALSHRRGMLEPVTLILVGVIVSIIAGAATLVVQHLLPDRGVAAARWLLGAINDDVAVGTLGAVGGACLALVAVAAYLGPAMDAASLSDDEARAVGVPLRALRGFLFVAAGALTAGAVVVAGPIGFVGLLCPHVVRMAAGPAHRTLVPASAVAGAALVVAADALVKSVELPSGRLPIGVVTAVLGGPLFIVMLRRELAATRA